MYLGKSRPILIFPPPFYNFKCNTFLILKKAFSLKSCGWLN